MQVKLMRSRASKHTGLAKIAVAAGVVAIGAIAIGALAIGALAIRKLAVGRAVFKSVHIEDLTVTRLHVFELTVDDELRQ
jgi:hypothetical protein